ncbi:hypothetical protein HXX76_003622 [Chlamydomonas incerta]|uniref:Uncharacterized protein n=1 Tax=Chlamydomonas incerta TaxID=51695 RepID=A0A835TLC7_CHLIN|nr:hypothetical protein HXX76_003622 [Chlamydomonas incerta]|eukprot:KAG2440766.1 hypothetical protein HXX76_003622 [Chlamydomonas incerta]
MARKKSSQPGKNKSKTRTKKNDAVHEATGGDAGGPRRSTAHAGPVPNLFWGGVSAAELRARTRFIPLPPAAAVLPLTYPAAARFLRQETDAWRALHTGVLTTGQLKEALGLREAAAARVVGGRKDSSHQPLIAAAKMLQAPHALPPPADAAADAACRRRALDGLCSQLRRPRGSQDPAAARGEQPAANVGDSDDAPLHPEEQYRRSAVALSSGGLMGVRCAWGKTQEAAALAALLHVFPSSTLHEVGMCCVAEADAPPGLFPLAASPDAIIAHHLLVPQQQVQRLQHGMLQQQQAAAAAACASAAVAADGGDADGSKAAAAATAVHASRQQTQRLRWQLRELLELVPMARAAGEAEEAGEQEEAEEGLEEASAQQAASGSDSEGGEDEEDEERESIGEEGPVDGRGVAAGGDVVLDSGSGDNGGVSDGGEEVSLTEASSAVLSPDTDMGGALPGAEADSKGCGGGLDSSCMDHGDSPTALHQLEVLTRVLGRALAAAAAAAAATSAAAPTGTATAGTSSCSNGAGACAGAAATAEGPHTALLAAVLESRLPAVVLCGDCGGRGSVEWQEACSAVKEESVLQQGAHSGATIGSGPSGGTEADMRPHLCCCGAGQRPAAAAEGTVHDGLASAAASGAAGASSGGGGLRHVVLREVVEVKSTCPFGMRQVRRGGKGRVHTELVLGDPGPRHAVPAAWVPQLQLHMLATGCQSALVVSRSASKGMTVFRLLRDDEYLQRMMGVLARLNNEYVRRGLTPPPDMFARQSDYCAFLGITARLARHATPLYPGRGVWRPPAEEALDRDDAFIRRPTAP